MTERKLIDMGSDCQSGSDTLADTEAMNITGLRKLVCRLHRASSGGALPLSLAEAAAEAIGQMQDVLAGAAAIVLTLPAWRSGHRASRRPVTRCT
jgi:hypothetical protein